MELCPVFVKIRQQIQDAPLPPELTPRNRVLLELEYLVALIFNCPRSIREHCQRSSQCTHPRPQKERQESTNE